MSSKRVIRYEVSTLQGFRKGFKDPLKARELYESLTARGKVYWEEWHGRKLVRSESTQGAVS